MERTEQGSLPFQSKKELGKVGEGRLCGGKNHVGRSQLKFIKASQTNLGVPRVLKDEPNSVSKTGGVSSSLAKRRDSGSRKRDRKGSFLSSLYSAKRQGQTSSNNRPIPFKQIDKEKRPKNARPQVSSLSNKTRYVGSETRSKRRLFPHSSPSLDLEVFQVLPEKERKPTKGLFLQKNALWSNHGSLGVLKGHEAPVEDPKTPRDHSVSLSGRLSDPGYLQGGSLKRHRGSNKAITGPWVQDELGQIFSRTSQDSRISGCSNKSGRLNIQSSRRKGPKDPSDLSILSRVRSYLKKVSRRNGRLSDFRRKLPKMGKALVKTSSDLDEYKHLSHAEGPLGAGGRVLQTSLSSLVKGGVPSSSNFLCGERKLKGNYDRCLRGGLVRSSPSYNPVGGLAGALETSFNELEGVKGNPSILNSFQGGSRRPESDGLNRQYDSPLLPKETRFLVLPSPAGPNSGYLLTSGGSKHTNSSYPLERENKCSGGSGVQEGSHKDRMVSGRQDVPMVLQPSGSPSGRLVCNPVQPETAKVCVPMPGPNGRGLGCPGEGDRLEQVEIYIPLSTIGNLAQGGWLAEIFQRGRIFNCPFLADTGLVPSFMREMSSEEIPTQNRIFIPEIFRQNSLPKRHFSFKPLRVEVIIEAVIAEGLTEFSAKVLAGCHRLSTLRQYQSVWKKFLEFLKANKIDHWKVNLRDIVNFLSFHAQKGKAYKTLAVYKNALRLPLLFKLGLNMDTPLISIYMRGMFNMVPPPLDDRMPKWDVNVVLKYLLSSEFCPPEEASFPRLEQKFFFLSLLGTGRRIHEIMNLSLEYKRRGENKVVLLWPRSFRAKNHNQDHSPSDPSIRRMTHVVRDRKELDNCPVVNWEVYLKRRYERDNGANGYLWEKSQAVMCASFKVLVEEALRRAKHKTDVAVRPHQVKKLSVSLCGKYWPNARELKLEKLTGNKRFKTLERCYIKNTPILKRSCSLPLGTAPPSDS